MLQSCQLLNALTVKTIRSEIETCSGKNTADILLALYTRIHPTNAGKNDRNPVKGVRALVLEMHIALSTMNLALNEDLRYQSYKRCKSQVLFFKKVSRKPSDKSKGTPELLKHSVKPGKNLVIF